MKGSDAIHESVLRSLAMHTNSSTNRQYPSITSNSGPGRSLRTSQVPFQPLFLSRCIPGEPKLIVSIHYLSPSNQVKTSAHCSPIGQQFPLKPRVGRTSTEPGVSNDRALVPCNHKLHQGQVQPLIGVSCTKPNQCPNEFQGNVLSELAQTEPTSMS